jgi:hypothetical protein
VEAAEKAHEHGALSSVVLEGQDALAVHDRKGEVGCSVARLQRGVGIHGHAVSLLDALSEERQHRPPGRPKMGDLDGIDLADQVGDRDVG